MFSTETDHQTTTPFSLNKSYVLHCSLVETRMEKALYVVNRGVSIKKKVLSEFLTISISVVW